MNLIGDIGLLVQNIQNIHSNIAKDVFPKGADMKCRSCGKEIHLSVKDCARSFAEGWPVCCNHSMVICEKNN